MAMSRLTNVTVVAYLVILEVPEEEGEGIDMGLGPVRLAGVS